MAVDFNILARVPTIGSQIMAGQEAGRETAARNMLLQQRQLEFEQAQEDRSRKLEAERLQTEARPRLAQMLRQMGQNPGDLKAATEFTAAAFESNNAAAVTAGQEWIKLARELAAPEKPVVVGGRLVSPTTGRVVYESPPEPEKPMAVGGRLVMPSTGAVRYEPPPEPEKPVVVDNRLVMPSTGAVRYEAPPKPVVSTIDTGSEIIKQEYNPATQTTRIISRIAKTLTPDQRRQAEQERKTVAGSFTDESGKVTQYNKFGEVITPTVGGQPTALRGKPSATFEKATAARRQLAVDLNRVEKELVDITKEGGLIDQSTGSGAGRMVDVGAGFFGVATPGAIAIGNLQPIADMVLKMVPRFEGPQSDKDTKSYNEAAGQLANATLPTEIRKAAGKTILRLVRERKGQFVTQEMAAEGLAPTPASGAVTGANPYQSLSNDDLLRQLGVKPGGR